MCKRLSLKNASVDFQVLLSRFSILFAGVISTEVYNPRKKNRKLAKIIPKSRRSHFSTTVSKRFLFFGCLCISSFAYAADVLLEFKAAYFYPTSHIFREIYPVGGPIYGVECSFHTWKGLYPWFSANYFSKSGHSIIPGVPSSVRSRTKIEFVPLGFGLKYVQQINRTLDLYFGLGALATYLHLRDHAPYVIQTSAKWGAGGIAKVGALVNFYKALFFDIAIDYSYMKVHFDSPGGETITRHTADLSGFSFGGGIGYRFGCR